MYSPNTSLRTHGRLVGRDNYFGVKVNFRDLLTSRRWNSGSRLCDIYTREVSRTRVQIPVSTPTSYGNRDCPVRKYDAAEACQVMESVRTSSTLCTLSGKGSVIVYRWALLNVEMMMI